MTNQSKITQSLVIRLGPQPYRNFPLNKTVLTIGREVDNDIVIDNAEVSRHHARIYWQDNQWVIQDLGSRNGTFVNGQRITGPIYFQPGAQVGLGPDVVVGLSGGAPAPARSKKPAPKKKGVRLPVIAGIVGIGLVGLIVLGVLAVAGYFYFNPTATLPFGLSQVDSTDPYEAGPTVVIQQPQPGVKVANGDTIFFSATATDDSGVIRIDLYVEDQIVLSQTSPDELGTTPFSLNYPLVATELGTYSLMVRAYNSLGLMGESPLQHVEVTEASASSDTRDLGQYVIQPGDTLENIASRAGTTVDAIIAANPGLNAGQLAPGQVILIPLPKAPSMAAAPPSNQQPGGQQPGGQQPGGQQPGGQQPGGQQPGGQQPGGQQKPPGVQPGALPGVNFMPAVPNLGNLRVVGGGLPGVVVNPGPGGVGNPNSNMKAPDPVQVSVAADCQVNLTWTDNSTNETGFDIEMYEPGSPFGVLIASIGPNTTGHSDTVPGSGKYEFVVVAVQKKGGKIVDYATSHPVIVKVPTTPACQPLPGLERMIFQAVEYTANGYSQGFINPIIDPTGIFLGFRLPQEQGKSIPPNDFSSSKYKIETWVPLSRSGLPIELAISGSGSDPNGKPFDLGSFSATHDHAELTADDRFSKIHQGSGQSPNGSFALKYKFYLEPWHWGLSQVQSSQVLPPPTDLKVTLVGKQHQLTWNYDKDILNQKVSGFNIYPQYFCPGYRDIVSWPLVMPRGVPPANPAIQTVSITKNINTLPANCACTYQVTAFGQGGESQKAILQNPLDCLTFASNENVTVTFKEYEVNNQALPQAQSAHVYLWANYYSYSTHRKALLLPGKHSLNWISFSAAGQRGDQPMTVGLGQGQNLQLGFYLGGICKSQDLILKAPAGGSWAGVDDDYTVSSANGDCKMTVHVKGSAAGQAPQNQPGGQNQPPQQPKYGQGCGDTGCSITFYNKTPQTIVGINFTRLSNQVIENPINQPGLVIPPNGSIKVDEFHAENYSLQAFYGSWAQGQAQPTITGNGPVSQAFGGTAQTVNIVDPNAPPVNANEALLRKLLTAGQPSTEYKLMWLFSNKGAGDVMCPTVICNDVLKVYSDGTFEFYEADVPGMVTSGTYQLNKIEPATGVASFILIPKDNKAKFSTAYFTFNTNLFKSMSLYVDVTTDTYGSRKTSFNPRVP